MMPSMVLSISAVAEPPCLQAMPVSHRPGIALKTAIAAETSLVPMEG